MKKNIILDSFALRQFGNSNQYQSINYDPLEFLKKVNEIYQTTELKNGYAPFCKHLIIKNFTETLCYIVEINDDNKHLIQSKYVARKEKELPVLKRFFSSGIPLQKAKYLDIILYSKEQITKENQAMNEDNQTKIFQDENQKLSQEYEYGIISIKPQNIDIEIPMEPITMMRNALGVKHGGSGIEIDQKEYIKSVEFWDQHVLVGQD